MPVSCIRVGTQINQTHCSKGIVGASPIGTELAFDAVHLMTGGRQVRGIIEGESISKLSICGQGRRFPWRHVGGGRYDICLSGYKPE
jgi:hypothetical protein